MAALKIESINLDLNEIDKHDAGDETHDTASHSEELGAGVVLRMGTMILNETHDAASHSVRAGSRCGLEKGTMILGETHDAASHSVRAGSRCGLTDGHHDLEREARCGVAQRKSWEPTWPCG